jgi:hypothetical protein
MLSEGNAVSLPRKKLKLNSNFLLNPSNMYIKNFFPSCVRLWRTEPFQYVYKEREPGGLSSLPNQTVFPSAFAQEAKLLSLTEPFQYE